MLLSVAGKADSFAQLLSVLVIFIFVLFLTLCTTKYIANYQKHQSVTRNMDVVETYRISNNKYIQIIRLGDTYVAIAVCKDTVTFLTKLTKEQIEFPKDGEQKTQSFKELLDVMNKKITGKNDSSNEV